MPKTRDNAPEPESFSAFLGAYNDINAMYDAFARRSGVSVTEYWAMLYISDGVTAQRELASALALSRQTVNSAICKLAQRGYITLEIDASDHRIKHACLTPAGEEFSRRHIDAMHEVERRLWESFGERERAELGRLLTRYRDAMRDALADVPAMSGEGKWAIMTGT